MPPTLSPGPSAPAADRCSAPYSEQMLTELLAMHEEMIVQLRVERAEIAGTAGFLSGLIAQHEKAAAQLRIRLDTPGMDPISADECLVIRENSFGEIIPIFAASPTAPAP